MPPASIQLVLQSASNSARIEIPGEWMTHNTLQQVMISIPEQHFGTDLNSCSIRYLHKIVDNTNWCNTTLKQMGIDQGRALLILQTTALLTNSAQQKDNPLEVALQQLLHNNFDEDSKETVVTLLKIMNNIIQKPHNPKVRILKLSNTILQKKIVARPGAVEFLVAAGFVKSQMEMHLLARGTELEFLLFPDESSTSPLTQACQMLVTKAISELSMTLEELLKSKSTNKFLSTAKATPPPTPTTHQQFNPYKGQKFNVKSVATGQSTGPDATYVSSTESALNDIKLKQANLESKLQVLEDRELVAFMPNQQAPVIHVEPIAIESASDGSLLAAQMKRQKEERKQCEEGGFTTKAMRELQQMKKTKVYASVILQIQFPDGSALSAKFLPKECIQVVKNVILECFCILNLDFDLYVAPPRQKLDLTKSLQEEGLVPAAKVFVSWKSALPASGNAIGAFLLPVLFKAANVTFPKSMALVEDGIKQSNKFHDTREVALLHQMMGGGKLLGSNKSSENVSGEDKNKKPKWFKG